MTIGTIRKKYPVDFACLHNDYVSTNGINILLRIDFVKRFEFDNVRKEIETIFYDNMNSYTDEFISVMAEYFTSNILVMEELTELELLRDQNECLRKDIENIKVKLNNIIGGM